MTEIKTVSSPGAELRAIIDMFHEYSIELNEDINFQDFGKELSNPLEKYGPPNAALIIALHDGSFAGCVALRTLTSGKTCEMKRLYVRPDYRSHSIGVTLCEAIINKAKQMKFETMVLDTLEKLKSAVSLYKRLGFVETSPYNSSPLKGVIYMKKDLG